MAECISCLESDGDLFKLGCKCTHQYWHKECFMLWVKATFERNGVYTTKCNVCNYAYQDVVYNIPQHDSVSNKFVCVVVTSILFIILLAFSALYLFIEYKHIILVPLFFILVILLCVFVRGYRKAYPVHPLVQITV